jgi:hypothetical protein
LLCPWIATFGWKLTREKDKRPTRSHYTPDQTNQDGRGKRRAV